MSKTARSGFGWPVFFGGDLYPQSLDGGFNGLGVFRKPVWSRIRKPVYQVPTSCRFVDLINKGNPVELNGLPQILAL